LVLVIDQFPADYLARFRERFGAGGLRRLVDGGARFTECAWPYAITDTAPGHSSLVSGTTPDRHGVVGNWWYDPALGRMVGAVEDDAYPLVGAGAAKPGASPHALRSGTLGDTLRLATGGRAKVFGVSEKPRAAVLLAGPSANGAFFFDQGTGRMVTSTWYAAALPDWVRAFDDARPADRWFEKGWRGGGKVILPPGEAGARPGPKYYESLPKTPYIDRLLLDFTVRLVEAENLGADDDADLLLVSLSAHDYLGHAVGPHAEAMAALTGEVDTAIASFLETLDRRVGRDRYLVALTADHGVAPTLETTARLKVATRGYDGTHLREVVKRALAERFGSADPIAVHGEPTKYWFDAAALARHKTTAAEAGQVAGMAAVADAGGALLGYLAGDRSDLDATTLRACGLSHDRERSPDLLLVRAPWALDREFEASDHGSPWSYDARVPLVLYGPPFRPGIYRQAVTPTDLAPTLADILEIAPPPMATGRVLTEALR
ncbi:MAG TPA: alkaline phosphatase family protein, partial [Candidatus Polarisedimenticolia bacterium]|nr:alkaline phosphatase family protein [Candidatus Polarisedimenticolia bacterium]